MPTAVQSEDIYLKAAIHINYCLTSGTYTHMNRFNRQSFNELLNTFDEVLFNNLNQAIVPLTSDSSDRQAVFDGVECTRGIHDLYWELIANLSTYATKEGLGEGVVSLIDEAIQLLRSDQVQIAFDRQYISTTITATYPSKKKDTKEIVHSEGFL